MCRGECAYCGKETVYYDSQTEDVCEECVERLRQLPLGKSCTDCKYLLRCSSFFGILKPSRLCDFYPSRFTPSTPEKEETKENEKEWI